MACNQWEAFAIGGVSANAGTPFYRSPGVGSVSTTSPASTALPSGGHPEGRGDIRRHQLVGGLFVSGLGTLRQPGLHHASCCGTTRGGYFYVKTAFAGLAGTADRRRPVFTRIPCGDRPPPPLTNDRVSRSFYDADGRVIATMDAAGGLGRSSATTRAARSASSARQGSHPDAAHQGRSPS